VLGHVLLRFTLAPENTAYQEGRTRLFWLSLLLAGGTSLVLLVLARRLIVKPLGALVVAANELSRGGAARVRIRANDEMGRLGDAFNGMAASIADREQRLAATSRELQQVLDNMVQAIVVFGPSGRIESVPSGQAKQIFPDMAVGGRIADALYPRAPKADVEARAFDVFVEAAFDVPSEHFAELAELAPVEATLPGPHAAQGRSTPVQLELAFRLLPGGVDGAPEERRVMMVATDVSEKRRLEGVVRRLDEQHTRQMIGMRRLLAGGGQVFLAFLKDAEERLARSAALLEGASAHVPLVEIDELFRHFHTLKGESRGFGLEGLLVDIEALEALLAPLRARAHDGVVVRSDHAPALLAGVRRAVQALEEGREVFVAASPIGRAAFDQMTVDRHDVQVLAELGATLPPAARLAIERLSARPFGESTFGLVESVPTWATQAGKRVRIEVEGRETRVPPMLQPVLPGLLTHLVRNAVAHGIEPSDLRLAAGKPAVGVVRLRCDTLDEGISITVSDDGAGLDETALRTALAARGGDVDLPTSELVFLAGLTSAAEVSELAGRGVGLAAVREDARRVGYAVTVSTQPNEGVVVVVAPSAATAATAATAARARAGSS
jgi:signal transduction histidine kinase